jgi:cation:H+ antiporter
VSGTVGKEIPVLVVLTPATLLLFIDQRLDRIDGLILLAAVAAFLVWITRTAMQTSTADPLEREMRAELPGKMSLPASIVWIAIGFVALLGGANMLVTGAENLARALGVSELVIGLTIIAVGTSLPELAVSVVSALKGEPGIAVGNIIGSNVFNLLAVIGIAGVIRPADLDRSVLVLHYPVMIAMTLTLLRIAYNPFGQPGFGRFMGFVLLSTFVAYQALLLTGNV